MVQSLMPLHIQNPQPPKICRTGVRPSHQRHIVGTNNGSCRGINLHLARAFYDDDVVCLIDVLLRERYLRDDDMHVRLSLPAKQLRRTLQFLEEEQLVKHELVDDLAMGGSQNTKFWYIE